MWRRTFQELQASMNWLGIVNLEPPKWRVAWLARSSRPFLTYKKNEKRVRTCMVVAPEPATNGVALGCTAAPNGAWSQNLSVHNSKHNGQSCAPEISRLDRRSFLPE